MVYRVTVFLTKFPKCGREEVEYQTLEEILGYFTTKEVAQDCANYHTNRINDSHRRDDFWSGVEYGTRYEREIVVSKITPSAQF